MSEDTNTGLSKIKVFTPEQREHYVQEYRDRMQNRYRTDWKHRLNLRLYAARHGRRKLKFPVTITVDQLIEQLQKQEYRCYYSGALLDLAAPKSKSVSLDRIDSSKGYEPGNVVICLWCINFAKATLTEEEFLEMCKSITDWQEMKGRKDG